MRLPAAWLGVQLASSRSGQLGVSFGVTRTPDQPLYGYGLDLFASSITLVISPDEEPGLRSFFAEVAGRAGRTMS